MAQKDQVKDLQLGQKLKVDKTFLPAKAIYFLTCAGSVCIVPFMSVYLSYLGLNPIQIGIAIGIQPLFGIIASPIFGSLADKFKLHRFLLVMCLFCVGLVRGSGVFFPLLNSNLTVSWTNVSNGSSCEHVHKTQDILRVDEMRSDENGHGKNYNVRTLYSNSKDTSIIFPLTVIYLILIQCLSNSSPIVDATTLALIKEYKERGLHAEYGRQRLWGAVSWGIWAPLSGLFIDQYAARYPESFNKYLPSFILSPCVYWITIVPALLIRMPPRESPASLSRDIGTLLRKPHIIMFFLVVFVSGLSIGILTTYLFLFLQELSGSHTLMGLTKTLTSASEVPFMFFAAWLIKKLSHRGVFALATFCFAVRFAGYALLTNPWLVLPIELLHGITQGALWPACASYVSVITPESMVTTMQALIYSTRTGLGRGVGTLVGGVVYHHFGPRTLFWAMTIMCVVTLVLYIPLSTYFERREAVRNLRVQYEEI